MFGISTSVLISETISRSSCAARISSILNDRKLMVDMERRLKPGGTLLLTTPSFNYRPMTRNDVGPFSQIEDGGHVRKGYTPEDLTNLCDSVGLEVIHIGYCSGFISPKITAFMRKASAVHPLLGLGQCSSPAGASLCARFLDFQNCRLARILNHAGCYEVLTRDIAPHAGTNVEDGLRMAPLSDSTVKPLKLMFYEKYVSSLEKVRPQGGASHSTSNPYLDALVRRHFPRDRAVQILEVGCGSGNMVSTLIRAGYINVRGIDVSPEQVQLARSRGLACIEQGDLIRELPTLRPESVGLVIAYDVLEHIPIEDLVAVVSEVRRVLEPDGLLVLHVPNARSPMFGSIRYGDITHASAFTPRSAAQLLYTVGFSCVHCYEDAPVFHGMLSGMRALLWVGIRAMIVGYIAVETGVFDTSQPFSQNMLVIARK
jgi:SAM-dependent methyltransferase